MDSRIQIQIEDPRQSEVLAVLADSDSYYAQLYPAERNHLPDASALASAEVTCLVVRVSGRAVGLGAVVRRDATFGEIKRMYLAPAVRGRKLGRLLLNALEDCPGQRIVLLAA